MTAPLGSSGIATARVGVGRGIKLAQPWQSGCNTIIALRSGTQQAHGHVRCVGDGNLAARETPWVLVFARISGT